MIKMNNQQLQKLVEKISMDAFHLQFNHQAMFNSRLRTTGGRYLLASHNIEINPKIAQNYSEEVLIGVIKHELCHYHLHLAGRGYQHRNRDFKDLLQKVNGSRFSPATLRPGIKVIYECTKCHHQYPRQRRMKINKYCCAYCGGKLKIVEEKLK